MASIVFEPFHKLYIQDVATLMKISYSSARKYFKDIKTINNVDVVTYKHFLDYIK